MATMNDVVSTTMEASPDCRREAANRAGVRITALESTAETVRRFNSSAGVRL
jgi:hypothetical protein